MPDSKRPPLIVPDRIIDPRSQPFARPVWRGNLPHLYKEGCTYFITFNLIDAAPENRRPEQSLEIGRDPDLIAAELDPEPSTGSCLLEDPKAASIVESSLVHFQGNRYALSAWCVMPNHVHVVVTPLSGFTLPAILHSWKFFSAHEINRALAREGTVWQEETFDHLVRDERAFERFVKYTENNPVVAGLCELPEDWRFGSARLRATG